MGLLPAPRLPIISITLGIFFLPLRRTVWMTGPTRYHEIAGCADALRGMRPGDPEESVRG